MPKIVLKYDPYFVFQLSPTPCGLYARQKWLGEAGTRAWQNDFKQTVGQLKSGQTKDGAWHQDPFKTIRRLFGLHLTQRSADTSIHQALDWLLEKARFTMQKKTPLSVSDEDIKGLPFMVGRPDIFMMSAVTFLATIFGRARDKEVLDYYNKMTKILSARNRATSNPSAAHNIMRALVVHPTYSRHEATRSVVSWFGKRQGPAGNWGRGIPFYQAINALAHISHPEVDRQLMKASRLLEDSQNEDGTWGEHQREWHTFLVVHALRYRKLV
jgi:hypothetical protein